MNKTERILEVTGYSVRTPITWLKDPTRHLLKIKAVNAKDSSDADAPPPPPDKPQQDDANNLPRRRLSGFSTDANDPASMPGLSFSDPAPSHCIGEYGSASPTVGIRSKARLTGQSVCYNGDNDQYC